MIEIAIWVALAILLPIAICETYELLGPPREGPPQ